MKKEQERLVTEMVVDVCKDDTGLDLEHLEKECI